MAKLSANGHEIVRLERIYRIDETTEQRVQLSFRSNGWVLKKAQLRFDTHPEWTRGAWKRYERLTRIPSKVPTRERIIKAFPTANVL